MSVNTLLLVFLLIFTASFSSAQEYYSGVFKSGKDSTEYSYALSWEALLSEQNTRRAKGFELEDVEAVQNGNSWQYAAIWKAGATPKKLAIVPGWDSLVVLKRIMAADTFVMQDIEAFTHKGKENFVVLWDKGLTLHKVRKLNSWEGVSNDYEEMEKRGLNMVDIEGFTAADGTTHYLALYHKRIASQRTHLYRASDLDAFNIDKRKRNKSGYQLFDFEHFEKRGVAFYFGIYEKTNDGGLIIESDTKEGLVKEQGRLLKEQQLRMTDIDMHFIEKER
jgi:hypothetical protein